MIGAQKIYQTFRAYLTIVKVVMLTVDTCKPLKNPHYNLNANETPSCLLKGRKKTEDARKFPTISEQQIV